MHSPSLLPCPRPPTPVLFLESPPLRPRSLSSQCSASPSPIIPYASHFALPRTNPRIRQLTPSQSEYAQDPSLKEVLWHSKCRRCLQNHWRCFISSDPKSPRKVCKPCGKNKCSFGYSTHRPKTYEDDGPDAPPSPGTHAHAVHAGLSLRFNYAATGPTAPAVWDGGGGMPAVGGGGGAGGAGGGMAGGINGGFGGMGGMGGGVNGVNGVGGGVGIGSGMSMGGVGAGDLGGVRSPAESSSSSSSTRPALMISTRDLTPRQLPLPISLKDAFHAFQPPPKPQPRLDTEPLNHSLTARPVSAPSSHSSATSHSSGTAQYTAPVTPAHTPSTGAPASGSHSQTPGHGQAGQAGQPGQASQGGQAYGMVGGHGQAVHGYYQHYYYPSYGYYDYSHYYYPHARERSPPSTPKLEPST